MLAKLSKIPALLLLCVFTSGIAFAQVRAKNPTTSADTTILEQLKDDIGDNIPVVSIDESDGQDGSAQNVSSQLSAGRDPFFNAATFKFQAVRFRLRGYDADMFGTYMNGAPMENLDNGFTPFGLWGGLNDVLRNRDNILGLRATPYAFGEIGGLNYLDTRASYQRKQTNFNYAVSNRNYVHRWMMTHSTGLNKKGWAFSVSGSRRWANEGFADGTFYDGWSFYGGVDKRINSKHLLSLVAFATPTKNGRQGSSFRESRELAGTNFYNPFWGYQNGKKRNSSVAKSFQPFGILTHDWKPNDKTSLVSAVSVTFGERSVSAIDWYNAADPRPDYYRNLPSYQEDPVLAAQVAEAIRNDVNLRQINWDNLYATNYGSFETIRNVDGVPGKTVSGRRSRYIVEERAINTTRYTINTTLNTAVKENISFTAGLNFQAQNNHYFKRVNDLLGGDFYVDLNQFAERDFPSNPNANQNDLNRPNRILKVGDKFGYNYNINIIRASGWMQAIFKFRKVDVFVSSEHSYTSFYRKGRARVGIFPENSFGKSKTYNFFNGAIKAGLTYKIDGRNYMFANGSYLSRAPYFDNAFIAARTRDLVHENLNSEQIGSVEAGYVMNAPRVKIRLTGYYTQLSNGLDVLTFYDDIYRNFANFAISNIGRVHAGGEFGFEAKVYKGLSIVGAAAFGRYRYNTRQLVTQTIDNSALEVQKDLTIYTKNFNVPTPQEAYTIGFDYRSPKFWFFNANFNYFNQMYLGFDPIRRSAAAVNGVEPGTALWYSVINQTRLPSQYTVDIFAGWSWLMNNRFKGMKKRTYMVLNVGVNNLLDNVNIVSGGFETLRFDFAEKDVNKFQDRRFFNYGRNFFASIGFRF